VKVEKGNKTLKKINCIHFAINVREVFSLNLPLNQYYKSSEQNFIVFVRRRLFQFE